ncbi:prolyl oligopeptidase family serine peptidase [Neorhodopirellula pilleata]|nr:prolyl oligopeptidase family serine peptidase [Neorhodopirellula pilleata]
MIDPHWDDANHFWFTRQVIDRSTDEIQTEIVDVDVVAGSLTVRDPKGADQSTQSSVLLSDRYDVRSSRASDTETEIVLTNQTDETVRLFWIDANGGQHSYGAIDPGQTHRQHTYVGHAWRIIGDQDAFYGTIIGVGISSQVNIDEKFDRRSNKKPPRRRPTPTDERWRDIAAIKSMLDQGVELRYPEYSPDNKVFVAWKFTPGDNKEVHRIESSPDQGGRARLHSQVYPLPGDRLDQYELIACDGETGEVLSTEMPVIDFGRPQTRWRRGHELIVEKVDRGHQRFRLFVINPLDNSIHTPIDETSSTFIWTSHGPTMRKVTYLNEFDAVIHATESSGWRHLEWIDLSGEQPARAITNGDYLVREILHVDEANRSLDLVVGEFHDDQDPYHRHLIRVGFDGNDLTVLTHANGDHEGQFSPDRQYVVTTHSRVDAPPVHALVRTSDGKWIATLATAARLGDDDTKHRLPTVFSAAGRDGETDIWGHICFPDQYDPTSDQRYPVIEAIYAGPHDSHVPKGYRSTEWHAELTSLGFIVVQIDGMGTANRSKAFHDVCWHNLKDAGFPDRIAWMKAAAKEHPAMDLDRVGIYGTSAGGQNACGALLFHGDFYKAAMASCGCHDNRMDKASWNEQWMGYPVGDHYAASSNIDNAHRLQGDLLLLVGELDSNVPPESTLRLVDALIEADKNFDFLMIPGLGHSDGGSYGRQKTRSFFVEKLRP